MMIRRSVGLAMMATLIAVSACGHDSTAPAPPPTATGTWLGTMHGGEADGITLSMSLVERDGDVTGSGSFISGSVIAVTATGTYAPPHVSVTLTEGGLHPPATLTGTIAGDTLTGTINGSGFVNNSITMRRQ